MSGIYNVVLAFDVKAQKQAQNEAISRNVQIFEANIIYHLFEYFKGHSSKHGQNLGKKHVQVCILQILPEYVANTGNPFVCGCYISGTVVVGQTLIIPSLQFLEVGKVSAIRTLIDPSPVERLGHGQIAILKIGNSFQISQHFSNG